MGFKVGDRVELVKEFEDGIYNATIGDKATVIVYGGIKDFIGVEFDKDIDGCNLRYGIDSGNNGLWINNAVIKLIEEKEIPTKLYQLYEYYSHEENRDDEFIYVDNIHIACYDGQDIVIRDKAGDFEELSEVEYLSDMFTIEIKPFYKDQDVKEITLEEIKEELGFDFKIVSREYKEGYNKHE